MTLFLAVGASSYLSYLSGLIAGLIPYAGDNYFLISAVQTVFFAAPLFLLSPLFWGCYRVFLLIARDERPPLSEIFCYFGNGLFKCALKFTFFLSVKILTRLFVSFIPLAASLLIFIFTPLRGSINPVFAAAAVSVLSALGAALFVYLSASLVYSPTAFTMMPEVSCKTHFRRSRDICQNQKGDIILFFLSFILWFLLGFFIIPMLWTIPYFFVTLIIFSFHLEKRYNSKFSPAANQQTNIF